MNPSPDEVEVLRIAEDSDVYALRRRVRQVAVEQGLSERAIGSLVVAVTEILRNVLLHAGRGTLTVRGDEGPPAGLTVLVSDAGPGIPDLARAMADGYSTAGGLGLGLSSAQRLVDHFEIESTVGVGTRVTLRMRAPAQRPSTPPRSTPPDRCQGERPPES